MEKSLGSVIADRRKEKKMTQLELAQKLGVTDKAVSKWERDLSCPDIGTLPVLARELDLSLDELLQGRAGKAPEKEKLDALISLVLKGVALAMGIGVTVLSALGQAGQEQAVPMLGLGLASLALWTLKKEN